MIYTFVIRSTAGAGIVSADSLSVTWSPAKRLTTDITIPGMKLYEFASSREAGGLQFYSLTTGTAKNVWNP